MPLFFVPEQVKITIGLDPLLLALLKQIIDQQSDRAAIIELSAKVQAQTAALKAALAKP